MTPHNAPPARSNFRLSEAEKTDARQALVLLNGIISLSACARAFLGLGLKPAGDSKPISEAVDAFILNCFSRNLREASVSSYNQALALGTSWMSSMGKAMNEIGVFGRSLESLGQMKVAFPFVGGERLNDARQKVSDLAASLAGMKAARDAGDETEELATKIKVAEQDARAAQAALNALNKTVDAQKVAMIRAGVAAEEYRKRATAIADLQNSFKGLAAGVDRFKDSFGKTVTLLRNSTMRLAGLTAASVVFAFCCRTGFEP